MFLIGFFLVVISSIKSLVVIKQYRKNIAADKRYIDSYYQENSWNNLPKVVTQIPLYNEAAVVRRVIDAVVALQYPIEKHEIQILDDSTDETTQIILTAVKYYAQQGIVIKHIHRKCSRGRAKALNIGLQLADADYIAIFDADFIPPDNFLLQTIPYFFMESKLAFVQTRWNGLNRSNSLLMNIQAASLHFNEISWKNVHRKFVRFRGAGVVLRKQAILDVGGWSSDTFADDTDFSKQAYYKFWQSKYLFNVICLIEFPENINDYKTQQYRWSQGAMQNAIKLNKIKKNLRINYKKFQFLKDIVAYSYNLIRLCFLFFIVSLTLFIQQTPYKDIFDSFMDYIVIIFSLISCINIYLYQSLIVDRKKALIFTPLYLISQVMLLVNNSFAFITSISGAKGTFKRTPKYGEKTNENKIGLILENWKETKRYWSIIILEIISAYFFFWSACNISNYDKLLSAPLFFLSLCCLLPIILLFWQVSKCYWKKLPI